MPEVEDDPAVASAARAQKGVNTETEEGLPAGPVDAITGEESNLLPNFRLNKVYEERPTKTNPLKDWRWLLVTFVLAALRRRRRICLCPAESSAGPTSAARGLRPRPPN